MEAVQYDRRIDLSDLKEEAIADRARVPKVFEKDDEVFSIFYGPGKVVRKAYASESSKVAHWVDFYTKDFSILADNLIALSEARRLGYKERYVGEPLPKKTRMPKAEDETELAYNVVEDLEIYGMRGAFVRESTKFKLEEFKLGQRVLDVVYGPGVVSAEKTITTVDVKIMAIVTRRTVAATYLLPYEKALEFGYTPRYEAKSRRSRAPLPVVRIIPPPPPRPVIPPPPQLAIEAPPQPSQVPVFPRRPVKRLLARNTPQ